MKIALDSWTLASRFRHHGTYVYAMNLIEEFKKLSGQDRDLEFRVFASDSAANDARSIEPGHGFGIAHTRLLDHDRIWRLGGAGFAAAKVGADLMFCPTTSILPVGSVPAVCTIHDATPVVMPSHAPRVNRLLRWLMWWTAKLARGIITGSERSKSDLQRLYGLADSQVHVVYYGCDQSLFNDSAPNATSLERVKNVLEIDRPYILHHGTIQPRKNLVRLIAAYRLLLSRNKNLDLDLVLAGNPGWEYEEVIAATQTAGRGRVILTGGISNSDLVTVIKAAQLAVMPSLYEGFCLPMVECMACGTPTVAADSSCLKEISGGQLLYFDPLSVEDMADCMQRALEDEGIRRNLIIGGKTRAREFDWAKCARGTLAVLKKYCSNGNR